MVVEDAAEVVTVGEDVGLVREVGAAGVDKVDAGESCGGLDWVVIGGGEGREGGVYGFLGRWLGL